MKKYARVLLNGKITWVQYLDGVPFELTEPIFNENPEIKSDSLSQDSFSILPTYFGQKVIGLAYNYKGLVGEQSKYDEPLAFFKAPTSVVGHLENVIYPEFTNNVWIEAELTIVIGKKAKDVAIENVNDYIFGYTCLNDITARDLQRKDGQWTRGKSFDTFCPMGPFIETDLDPGNLKVQAKLNGELVQDGNTSEMIFKVDYIVSFVSQIMTLLPGDVISTGTPEGISSMQPGDTIEITVQGIGTLINKVKGRTRASLFWARSIYSYLPLHLML